MFLANSSTVYFWGSLGFGPFFRIMGGHTDDHGHTDLIFSLICIVVISSSLCVSSECWGESKNDFWFLN